MRRITDTVKMTLDTLLKGELIEIGNYEFKGYVQGIGGKEFPIVYIGKILIPKKYAHDVVKAVIDGNCDEFGYPMPLTQGYNLVFYKQEGMRYEVRKKKV